MENDALFKIYYLLYNGMNEVLKIDEKIVARSKMNYCGLPLKSRFWFPTLKPETKIENSLIKYRSSFLSSNLESEKKLSILLLFPAPPPPHREIELQCVRECRLFKKKKNES